MARAKIGLVGAGQIGGTLAMLAGLKELGDIAVVDVAEGVPQGKSLDLSQVAPVEGFDAHIVGSNSYDILKGSDVVIVTAGIPRKPGMTREELIGINAGIVKTVTENVLKHSPEAIIIVVSNPMDTMTYLALKESKLPKNRIIGMGGILDSARFKCYLSQL